MFPEEQWTNNDSMKLTQNQPYIKKKLIDFQNFRFVLLVKPLELCIDYNYCLICPKTGCYEYGHT